MDTKKEITRILNKVIDDFNSKWCGHDEKDNGISKYADELVKIIDDQANVSGRLSDEDCIDCGCPEEVCKMIKGKCKNLAYR